MKILYKSVMLIASGIISVSVNAQTKNTAAKDTTISRQVMLERDYTPTYRDASKINTLPTVYDPVIQPQSVTYMEQAPQIMLSNNRLGTVPAGDIRTGVEYDEKRGYLLGAGGMYGNIDAALGYDVVRSGNDKLSLFGAYSSTNGKVDYADKGHGYILDKAKAKYSDITANLAYKHIFESAIFKLSGSFGNLGYNYYGNSFLPSVSALTPPQIDKKQSITTFGITTGVSSNPYNEGILRYDVNIGYDNFKSKYGPTISNDGPKGGIIKGDFDFNTSFDSDLTIGAKGKILNQSFNGIKFVDKDLAYHGLTNLEATPYLKLEGRSWNARVGVNLGYVMDKKNKFFITPDVHLSAKLSDVNEVYLSATGGVNENSFLQMLQENRYVNPMARVGYSNTLYDAKIGFRSGVVDGFEFDIFGGYKETKKDHLYTTNDYSATFGIYDWGNLSNVTYANVSTGHVGGLVKTHLIPYTTLSAKVIGYFYTVKYTDGYSILATSSVVPTDKKAWGRPTLTADLNADVQVTSQLLLSLGYQYGGGRKAYLEGTGTKSMKDINELNIKAEYQILDFISANVRCNNLLNQKYELQYGYTLQGLNIMGGINLKF